MGIGPHAIKLTRIIKDAGVLPPGFGVIELGSQDFAPTPEIASAAILREFGYQDASSLKEPADLYRAMGARGYECIDLDSYHGSHVFDLNVNLEEKYGFASQYELVTNHGTTEHLFNQLVAFENVHRLTAVGGVMLHALPFQGYQNHGMFNYNPSLFLDLAVANGYDVFGIFLSINDKLYLYDEDFLFRNSVRSAEDCLVLAVLIKRTNAPFEAPYDGRYFSVHGKGAISALEHHIGTTRRSFGNASFEYAGLDEWENFDSDYSDRRYRFITPVWGRRYVEDYVSVTLPSQLSENNLVVFSGDQAVYTIVTTPGDADLIKKSPAYEALTSICPVEFIFHQGQPNEHSYDRMTRAYNLALAKVSKSQTCFFLTSDDFYSDGLLRTAKGAVEGGKRAVMVPTVRVVGESFRAELDVVGKSSLPPRETVAMMLRHEHPMATSCTVNDKGRILHRLPAQTLYRLRDGYVGRWNVMHPLAVKVRAFPRPIDATVDWNYPALNVSGAEDIHVVRDSDEGIIASLTPVIYSQSEEYRRHATRRRRTRTLKDWVDIDWALNFHVLQMSEPVYLHTGELGPEFAKGLTEVDRVWRPFLNYIKRRETPVPETAKGYTLDLLTRATLPNPFGRVRVLLEKGLLQLRRKATRKTYNRLRRMV